MSDPTAESVLSAALAGSIEDIVAPVAAAGDTVVHRMRVGCRRLRSDLRTFQALLDPRWTARVRGEVGVLRDLLGPVRDAEVLLARLTGRNLPGAEPIAAALRARQARAQDAAEAHLASPEHAALLATLAEPPPFLRIAHFSAASLLPVLVAKPWHHLARQANALKPSAPDSRWHTVRISTKHARYALEAALPALPSPATSLIKSLTRCQTLLGEHQDAVTAQTTWRSLIPSLSPILIPTLQALIALDEAAAYQAKTAFRPTWHHSTRPKTTNWLPPTPR